MRDASRDGGPYILTEARGARLIHICSAKALNSRSSRVVSVSSETSMRVLGQLYSVVETPCLREIRRELCFQHNDLLCVLSVKEGEL